MAFALFRIMFAAGIGVFASAAAPITYIINFTGPSPLPASGSFVYDADVPAFTNFVVNWNGIAFDLTDSANSPTAEPTSCAAGVTGPAATFILMTVTPPCDVPGWTGPVWWGQYEPMGFSSFQFRHVVNDPIFVDPPGRLKIDLLLFGLTGEVDQSLFLEGTWSITAVPEPAAILLTMAGGSILLALGRRKAARDCRCRPTPKI